MNKCAAAIRHTAFISPRAEAMLELMVPMTNHASREPA